MMGNVNLTPAQIIKVAELAAFEAMEKARPTPMVVTEHANPFDDNSPVKRQWHVDGGACGFAWVHIYPAKGPIVNELKRQSKGHKGYPKGWDVWMGQLTQTQSIEIKEAGARAYANVLKNHGVQCYADSRMD